MCKTKASINRSTLMNPKQVIIGSFMETIQKLENQFLQEIPILEINSLLIGISWNSTMMANN